MRMVSQARLKNPGVYALGFLFCLELNLFVQLGQTSFFIEPLLSKTPPPSARSPRRRPLRHEHRSRCHQTVLPLQLRLLERNHQKTDDYQSVRRDQRVSRILNYQIFTWSCFYKSSVLKKDRTTVLAASAVSELSSGFHYITFILQS